MKRFLKNLGEWIATFLSGTGLGLLVGLSLTPVVATVVGVLTALCAGLAIAAQSIRFSTGKAVEDRNLPSWAKLVFASTVRAGPTMLLIAGVATGAWRGLEIRVLREQQVAKEHFDWLTSQGVAPLDSYREIRLTNPNFGLYVSTIAEHTEPQTRTVRDFVNFARETIKNPSAASSALRHVGGRELPLDCSALNSSQAGRMNQALEEIQDKGVKAFLQEFPEPEIKNKFARLLCP